MASSNARRHSKKASEGAIVDIDPQDVVIVDEGDAADTAPGSGETAGEQVLADEGDSMPGEIPEESAARETAPQPVQPVKGGSGALLGGLAGGVIALVGAAGLQWAGILPSMQNNGEIAALQQQISALSEKGAAPEIDPAVIEGLVTAQAGLQKNAESIASGLAAVEESQKALNSDVSALKAAGGVGSGDPAVINGLLERLAALENSGGAEGLSAKIDDLGAKFEALQQNTGSGSGAGAVARAIAAAGLKAAIDRGGSFASELETYATVSPDSPELAQLKNLAGSGVPSKTELTAQFAEAANKMIEATRVADPNSGLLQRLADSAKSMVRSRPVGDVAGDAPEALIARMEVAVNRGDLDAALEEAAKLPENAREAGADYLGKLTARRDTDALVTKALTSALGAAGAAK